MNPDLTRFFYNRTQKMKKKNQKKTLKMGQKIKKMSPIMKKSCYFGKKFAKKPHG